MMTNKDKTRAFLILIFTGVVSGDVSIVQAPVVYTSDGEILWMTCRYDVHVVQIHWTKGGFTGKLSNYDPSTECPSNGTEIYNICEDTQRKHTIGLTHYKAGDVYVCTVLNDSVSVGESATIKVSTRVYVEKVLLSPSASHVVVNDGGILNLSCVSEPYSRPNASIRWIMSFNDDQQIEITNNITAEYQSDANDDHSSYKTVSYLSYEVSSKDHNSSVYCISTGGKDGDVYSSRAVLIIRYHPNGTLVLIGNNTLPVYEGDLVTMTCTVTGGNPTAKLSWTCKGDTKHGTNYSTQMVASSKLNVLIDSSYHDRICECTANHIIPGFSQTLNTSFVVYSPPGKPFVYAEPKFPWIAMYGNSGRLFCNVTPGYPIHTIISWLRGSEMEINQKRSVRYFNPPTSFDDKAIYTCQAENAFTDHKGTDYIPTSSPLAVSVVYPPENPVNIVVSVISNTSARVSWTPGYNGGKHQQFHVWYRESSTPSWIQLKTVYSPEIIITHLQPLTYYSMIVYAENDLGTSDNISGNIVTYQVCKECPDKEDTWKTILIAVAAILYTASLGFFIGTLAVMRICSCHRDSKRRNQPKIGKRSLSYGNSDSNDVQRKTIINNLYDTIPGRTGEDTYDTLPDKKPEPVMHSKGGRFHEAITTSQESKECYISMDGKAKTKAGSVSGDNGDQTVYETMTNSPEKKQEKQIEPYYNVDSDKLCKSKTRSGRI